MTVIYIGKVRTANMQRGSVDYKFKYLRTKTEKQEITFFNF